MHQKQLQVGNFTIKLQMLQYTASNTSLPVFGWLTFPALKFSLKFQHRNNWYQHFLQLEACLSNKGYRILQKLREGHFKVLFPKTSRKEARLKMSHNFRTIASQTKYSNKPPNKRHVDMTNKRTTSSTLWQAIQRWNSTLSTINTGQSNIVDITSVQFNVQINLH